MSVDSTPSPSGPQDNGPAAETFRHLAQLVYSCDDYDEVYQAICQAAPLLVGGCDRASLMISRKGVLQTAAASDEIARQVDDLELELGEGPCVETIEGDTAHNDPDLTRSPRWPTLARAILERTPVRGAAAFRLAVDRETTAALNLFSDTPNALTGRSMDQAAVLASFTSVALMAASRREAASTLQEGLASNREIGKAVGLLMALHKVGDEEAFGILRRASQDLNIKLVEVARRVVEDHNLRPPQ